MRVFPQPLTLWAALFRRFAARRTSSLPLFQTRSSYDTGFPRGSPGFPIALEILSSANGAVIPVTARPGIRRIESQSQSHASGPLNLVRCIQRGGLMPLSKLREFLDSRHIRYLVISHSLAYTAQGIAALTHVSGKRLAKTVIVKIDGILAMAVVPASVHVDLDRLRTLTGAQTVELATEREFKDAFPDCETGAMPPFGNLYDMSVYADASLAQNEEFTFSAGTHRELVRMNWDDMVRLVNPLVAHLTHGGPVVVAA